MNPRWTLLLSAVLIVAFASPTFAVTPLTQERFEQAVERVAPAYPTVPARTLCVCQTANDPNTAFVGYLNSFVAAGGTSTVNMVCVYPLFFFGTIVAEGICPLFQIVK